MDAIYIIITASLVAITCSILGCFLVLRKMAMVGDAISHSLLPGIVMAVIITGTTYSFWGILGASVFGVLATVIIEFIHKKGKLQTDASIGITFTFLFSIGVILISYYAENVHIDEDCVLHGELAYVPLDMIYNASGTPLFPRSTFVLLIVVVIILLVVVIFFKELVITTFDAVFAKSVGYNIHRWHYLLMVLVSITTVASFESVGAILVIAFLIVPAASAYLISKNIKHMMLISSLVGIGCSIGGYWLSYAIDGSIAASIVVVNGALFALFFLGKKAHQNLLKAKTLDTTLV